MVLFYLRGRVCDEKEDLEEAEGQEGVGMDSSGKYPLFADFTDLQWPSMPKDYAKAMTRQSLSGLAGMTRDEAVRPIAVGRHTPFS